MNTSKLLQELAEVPGPSGLEMPVAEVLRRKWEPFVDSISIDTIGSLVAIKNGQGKPPRKRLLVAAHMDEIGLMVKKIIRFPDNENGSGFLRVVNIGGVDTRHLYGQMVVVHGSLNGGRDLVGILGSLPARMLPESRRDKPFGFEELVVDVGFPGRVLEEYVSVGDFISFRQPLRRLLNKRAAGKALDNRVSLAAITICLEYLSGRRHDWDIVAVATAQEETTLLGAFTSAHAQAPDAAVALDVTFGKGPGANEDTAFELGRGPTVGLGPNVHPGLHGGLMDAAAALELKVHVEPHTRHSGTDAFGLQIAREGIPTGLVSIPLRYMHTMVETVALGDIERAGRLIGEFVARLDDEFLDSIAQELVSE